MLFAISIYPSKGSDYLACFIYIAAISNYMQIFWIMQSALGPHCLKFDFQSIAADDTTEDLTQLWQ